MDTLDGLVRRLDPDELASVVLDLEVQGYVRLPGLMSDQLVKYLLDLVSAASADDENIAIGTPQGREADRVVYHLPYRDPAFTRLLDSDPVRAVAARFLNDHWYREIPQDEPNYILHYYNARSSGTPLDLHIDSYIPFSGPELLMMQIAFVLEDQSEQNGCTVVVPGSHQSGRYPDRDFAHATDVEATAGDVVIWDSRLWHGAKSNRTEGTRWVAIATLSRWWLKQKADFPTGMPKDIVDKLTPRQLALLGFASIPPTDADDGIQTKKSFDEALDAARRRAAPQRG